MQSDVQDYLASNITTVEIVSLTMSMKLDACSFLDTSSDLCVEFRFAALI
jgi:hypothetical protein